MRARRRWRCDGGSLTAEFALLLPSVVLAALMGLTLVLTVHSQLLCVDAAREGARQAARGEEPSRVVATAQRLGPEGARVSVERVGDRVVVDVRAKVRPLGKVVPLPGFPVAARASVEAEDQ